MFLQIGTQIINMDHVMHIDLNNPQTFTRTGKDGAKQNKTFEVVRFTFGGCGTPDYQNNFEGATVVAHAPYESYWYGNDAERLRAVLPLITPGPGFIVAFSGPGDGMASINNWVKNGDGAAEETQ